MNLGKFIVLEGLEGAGKSTALAQISEILSAKGIEFVTTREPGGTPLAEKMREIVKSDTEERLTDEAELLLMYASRVQLIENVIKPNLENGVWVLGDRHDLSSLAYQGGGREISDQLILPIRNAVLKGFKPDLTVLMDLDPRIGLSRAKARGELDRIEQQAIDFFDRTRAVYLKHAAADDTIKIIDAGVELAEVQAQIQTVMSEWLK